VAHELGRGQLRCFASREYLRDRGTPLTPSDLRRHECILFTPFAPRGRWTFRSRGRAMEVPVRGRLVVNSLPLAIEAAARGLGIARLPGALVIEGLAANQLVEVLDAYAPPARFYAVHASGVAIVLCVSHSLDQERFGFPFMNAKTRAHRPVSRCGRRRSCPARRGAGKRRDSACSMDSVPPRTVTVRTH
jgi:hypothetical protein